ncbi:MAG TPA: FKBP-type peptidyl-prolyl cis-trans isomerase [Lacunisphaera sp.]|nr:FKBP-type peptidyl-prolyl cis-trans isomerase [Lacunisphaera sp.]
MKTTPFSPGFLAVLAALALTGCGDKKTAAKPDAAKPAAASAAFTTVDQKVSYGLGFNLGQNLSREKLLQLDRAALAAGIDDGLAGGAPRLPEADLNAAFGTMRQKAAAAAAAEGEKQLAAGKDYLAKNKAKAGVKTTASGLQYEVLKKGTGAKPTMNSTVQVHYHGTLIDGTVFDSSVQRGQPIEFAVTGVIRGWTEALQLMSVGDKWKLTVPSDLAYGPQGRPGIPPNAVLVFEVELLGIK